MVYLKCDTSNFLRIGRCVKCVLVLISRSQGPWVGDCRGWWRQTNSPVVSWLLISRKRGEDAEYRRCSRYSLVFVNIWTGLPSSSLMQWPNSFLKLGKEILWIILSAFAVLRKATNNFVISVCPFVCPQGATWLLLGDWHVILYLNIFRKSFENIYVS